MATLFRTALFRNNGLSGKWLKQAIFLSACFRSSVLLVARLFTSTGTAGEFMKRRFQMRASSFKNLLSALLVFVLLIGLLPTTPSVSAQTTNLALNKPTTCSPTPQFPCAEAVDGNATGTRWASAQGV